MLLLAAIVLPGCGKKGSPLPALQIVPARVEDLTAFATDDRIELQFTVPAAGADAETVVRPDRIEIYRVATAPEAALNAVGDAQYRRAEITVRPPDAAVPPAGTPNAPIAPGDRASFVDTIASATTDKAWTYVAVGVVGRSRRGPASVAVTVPLATRPDPPTGVTASHDETTLTLAWTGDSAQYRVFGLGPTAAGSPEGALVLLTPKPVTDARFQQPVEFGRQRCFVVRTAIVAGSVTVEGPPSPVTCLTPEDRYPPAPPANLRVIQEGSAITLTWTPVEASDLAGYVVLRGDEAGVNLQPLIRDPVRETTFRDESVRSGTTYTYSVYAVDNSPQANVSQQSERLVVTVR